jgi:hypothetical protein
MAAVISPTTGRRYGVAQVCRVWEVPRSSFYTPLTLESENPWAR